MSYSPQTIKRLSAWCLCVLAVPTCWPYSLHIHHNVTGVCVCWPSPHICLTAYIYIIMWLGFVCRVGQNHIYTVYLRCFWQGNHQIYCHIRCIYTVLASPICVCWPSPHICLTAHKHSVKATWLNWEFALLSRCLIDPHLRHLPHPPPTHIHTHMHVCKHTHIHTRTHVYARVQTHTHTHTHQGTSGVLKNLRFARN